MKAPEEKTSFVAKMGGEQVPDVPTPPPPSSAMSKDYKAYERFRKDKGVMLDIRMTNKAQLALSYSYINVLHFDPRGQVVIESSSYNVTLRGRNLKVIFDELMVQNVAYVQEGDVMFTQGGDPKAPFIEKIIIEQPG